MKWHAAQNVSLAWTTMTAAVPDDSYGGEMEINSNDAESGANDVAPDVEREAVATEELMNVEINESSLGDCPESRGEGGVDNTETVAPNIPCITPGATRARGTEHTGLASNEAIGYLPEGPRRSFMFCWTEKWKTLRQVDAIEIGRKDGEHCCSLIPIIQS